MPITYTNQPKKLKITATLEMEDGQIFSFDEETTDFSEDGDTVASYFDTISEKVYDKLEDFVDEVDGVDENGLEYDASDEYDYFDGLEERDVVC